MIHDHQLIYNRFAVTFGGKYTNGSDRDRGRYNAFQAIAYILLRNATPIQIVETGGLRSPDNWDGDGCSTRVWDWLAWASGGSLISIDVHAHCGEHMRNVCTAASQFHCGDSVDWLRHPTHPLSKTDLLYLDSFDYVNTDPGRASLHAAAELAACWDALPSGCLIAIDDCISAKEGKHLLVALFFKLRNIFPVVSGYVTAWRKP